MLLVIKKHLKKWDKIAKKNPHFLRYGSLSDQDACQKRHYDAVHSPVSQQNWNFFYDQRYINNLKLSTSQHNYTIKLLNNHLNSHNIEYHQLFKHQADCLTLSKLFSSSSSTSQYKDLDHIITVGGDGTLLHGASLISDTTTLLMGIKSISNSVGHLCCADQHNLADLIDAIKNNAVSYTTRIRLQALIIPSGIFSTIRLNNKDKLGSMKCKLIRCVGGGEDLSVDDRQDDQRQQAVYLTPCALNDILFTSAKVGNASRYILRDQGLTPSYHISSGVWIYTPTGSSAGAYAAGAPIIENNYDDPKFGYYIREMYKSEVLDHSDNSSEGDFFHRSNLINNSIYNVFSAKRLISDGEGFDKKHSLQTESTITIDEKQILDHPFAIKNMSDNSCLIIDGKSKIILKAQDLVVFFQAPNLRLANNLN